MYICTYIKSMLVNISFIVGKCLRLDPIPLIFNSLSFPPPPSSPPPQQPPSPSLIYTFFIPLGGKSEDLPTRGPIEFSFNLLYMNIYTPGN